MSSNYIIHDTKYEYRSFTHTLTTEDSLSFPAYGIELYVHDVSACIKSDCIPGITTRYEKIKELLELLNRAQVSPCHFRDVVEDFLS